MDSDSNFEETANMPSFEKSMMFLFEKNRIKYFIDYAKFKGRKLCGNY